MRFFILVCGFFSSFNVSAKCDQAEADKGMSLAMQQCASAEFVKSDAKLNKIYKGIIQNLKKQATESSEKENAEAMIVDLKASQRDWVKFRDSECTRATGAYLPNAGREAQILYSLCPAKMTEERIKVLQAKCNEGDVLCVGY